MRNLLEQAKRLIGLDSVRVVSFDLFDTLLCRPALFPGDILRFVCQSEGKCDTALWNARLSVERVLGDTVVTNQRIWDLAIAEKGIEPEKAKFFAQQEFALEKKLVFPRECGRRIFSYAVQKGKRIIVISDMHFSRVQLLDLLKKCGYNEISRLYVSSEEICTKRSGVLFDKVLAAEKIAPEEMLHIGDSRKADWIAPSSRGIYALHLPKSSRLLRDKIGLRDLWMQFQEGTYESVLYGFAVNQLENYAASTESMDPLYIYAHLVVFPLLVHMALTMLVRTDIQQQGRYNTIYFVSRDGYLTKQAYDILAPYFSRQLPSRYLQGSRLACRTLVEQSYFDKLSAKEIPDKCTLEEFLVATVADRALQNKILFALAPGDKRERVQRNRDRCAALLAPFHEELENFHQASRAAACEYYTGEFGDASRVLLADCGFCGTIAAYLTEGFRGEKKFDKIFFWENETNRRRDRQYETVTYTAFTEKKGCAVGPLIESLFSELTGSCIGFYGGPKRDAAPWKEQTWQPENMIRDIALLQKTAVGLVEKFADMFKQDLQLLEVQPPQMVMEFVKFFQEKEPFASALFSNIFFKESYRAELEENSLAELIALRKAKKGGEV